MPSCARGIHLLSLRGILVAYFDVEALCCLKVVVAGYWLCCFGPPPAVGLPQSFLVAKQALLSLLYPFGLVRRLSGRFQVSRH